MTEFRYSAGHIESPPYTEHQANQGQITRARQAAEALFTPKRLGIESEGPVVAPSVDEAARKRDQAARKPRILRAVSVQLPANEAHLPANPAKQLPAGHLTRIRTWLKYGMTARQAAKVCGMSVSEIESLLHQR